MGEVRDQTLNGAKWTYFATFSNKGIQFAISVILARMLTPSDYGLVGMLGIFLAIAGTFVDSGMTNALIRKKDATTEDFSTVFYFNIAISTLCYMVLFTCAPWIAYFFHEPLLKNIIRVISINLIIGSLGAVQGTIFTKNLDFKTNSILSIITNIISGSVGIAMAYMGYGVWALVFQSLASNIGGVILKWAISKWRPLFLFSKKSFKELFGFGSKLLVSGLLHTFYENITTLLIGKFYTPSQLGYYSRGENFPSLVSGTILWPLLGVTFPIMSKHQDDDQKLIYIYRTYLKAFSLLICFLLVLLAALSKPIILILLTEKWEASIPYMQIFCFVYMTNHMSNLNLNLLQVKGRSDLFLRLEIIKKSISLSMLLCAVPFGVMAICLMKLVYSQIAIFINTYYTGKLLNLGYLEQMKDFFPYLGLSLLSCLPAFILTYLNINLWITCIIGAAMSIILYSGILLLIKDDAFKNIVLNMLLKRLRLTT